MRTFFLILAMLLYAGNAIGQDTPTSMHTDTAKFCITFPLFTVCHEWEYTLPMPILTPTVKIKGSVKDKNLTLTGFPKSFEGRTLLLKANENLLPKCNGLTSEFYILAGKYKVKQGVTVMKLERPK